VSEDLVVEVGGLATRYFRGGDGPPLVCLHGAAPAGEWLPFHDALAQHLTVYAPDHPGFGGTPRPDWLQGMDDLVLHYEEFFRVLGLERPAVFGFSLGGWIAAEFAVYYPDRLRGLVLHNAGGLHLDEAIIPDLLGMDGETLARTVFADMAAAQAYFGARRGLEERLKTFRSMTTLALLAWNPWFNPQLAGRLRRISTPTLVLWAEHDRLIPPVYGEAYRDGIPGAALEILPGCGHMAPVERPEAVAEAVRRFLL
jgi:pimeloyl-ACP methyl ester carboxylesterase